MHWGLKSFKKDCLFLLKSKQRTLSCVLTNVEILMALLLVILFSLRVFDPAMHSGKVNIRHHFCYGELHA